MTTNSDHLPNIILGIVGAPQSGRNTLAHMLAKRYDAEVIRLDAPTRLVAGRLADPSTIGVAMPEHVVREWVADGLLQADPTVLLRLIAPKLRGIKMVIVPDIRTQEEALMCSYIMYIERPGTNTQQWEWMRAYSDAIIHNNGDLIDLEIKADQIVADSGGGPHEGDGGKRVVY